MVIHKGYENLNLKSPVVTLGIFDGVHKGHRFLLDTLIRRAREINGESVVITFNPHPRLVLEKNAEKISFLSTIEEKISLLDNAGINHLIIIEFTLEFSRIKAYDFVKKVLLDKIGTRYLILGHDHHFGYRGEGNFETVKSCAESLGFRVEQVDGFRYRKVPVSSSVIREDLSEGKIEEANNLLGYSYSIKGVVTEGRRLGNKLGYPTANIEPGNKNKLIPAEGVYAVKIKLNNFEYKGVLNIGRNPTINKTGGKRSIEANIFDFDGDIYGKEIEILFKFRIRDEKVFSNIEQLSQQIGFDREKAMELLT